MLKVAASVFVMVIVALCNGDQGHYWRDYTGEIPKDAFEAGKDVNHKNVYIGSVYLKKAGIVPTTIYPGKDVDEILSVGDSDEPENSHNVQILCTKNPKKLEWITANITHFRTATNNKYLVRGGVQNGNWLYIGKVYYQNEAIIGKIFNVDTWPEETPMHYVHNKGIKAAYSYKVLKGLPPKYRSTGRNIHIINETEIVTFVRTRL